MSHWGNIAIEELYELKHAGAKLKGGFSRFDYQMKKAAQSPSFRSLIASLPATANNIYYRDQIGNISTSDIRIDADGDIELEVRNSVLISLPVVKVLTINPPSLNRFRRGFRCSAAGRHSSTSATQSPQRMPCPSIQRADTTSSSITSLCFPMCG